MCGECLWCGILVESEWIGWMRLIEAHGKATNGIDDHMWVQAKLLHFKRILPLNSLLYFALFVLNSLLSAFSSTIKCPCNLEHFCRIFTLLTFVIRFNGYHAKINFNWLQWQTTKTILMNMWQYCSAKMSGMCSSKAQKRNYAFFSSKAPILRHAFRLI